MSVIRHGSVRAAYCVALGLFYLLSSVVTSANEPSTAAAAVEDYFETNKIISDEYLLRLEIKAVVSNAFQNGDIDFLEAVSTRYRTERSRTYSGAWRLYFFYQGLAEAAPSDPNNEELWRAQYGTLEKWREKYPNSPTAHLAYAAHLVEHAWTHRGGGWAHTVSEEGWVKFGEHLTTAEQYIRDNIDIVKHDPHHRSLLVYIGTGLGHDRADLYRIVAQHIKDEPEYHDTYFKYALGISPKWGGSRQHVEVFANKIAKATKVKSGDALYARIYWSAFGANMTENSNVRWSKMKSGIDDVLDAYPDAWNLNNFAWLSCLAGDGEKTRELLMRLQGGQIYYGVVWPDPEAFDACGALAGFAPKSRETGIRTLNRRDKR